MKMLAAVALLAIAWIHPVAAQDKRPLAVDESMAKEIQNENIGLKKSLAEYHSGKRPYTDGFVILRRLYENNHILRMGHTAEAREVERELESLKAAHPDLASNPPDKLGEEAASAKAQKDEAARLREKAKNWTPSDKRYVQLSGHGKNVVARHQYKLVFYSLPSGAEYTKNKENRLRIFRGGKEIDPSALAPRKVMSFRHTFDIRPNEDEVKTNFLVCTNLLVDSYDAMDDEEMAMIEAKGRQRSIPWTNPTAPMDQFCGIVSVAGDVIYTFPITQKIPGPLAYPLGISADGKRAGIMIGEKLSSEGEDGESVAVGKPRQVWVWEHPAKLKKILVKNQALTDLDVRDQFYRGEF